MAEINPTHLQMALKGVSDPASKDDLIARARDAGANELLGFLGELPDRELGGPDGVTKEISADS